MRATPPLVIIFSYFASRVGREDPFMQSLHNDSDLIIVMYGAVIRKTLPNGKRDLSDFIAWSGLYVVDGSKNSLKSIFIIICLRSYKNLKHVLHLKHLLKRTIINIYSQFNIIKCTLNHTSFHMKKFHRKY